MKKIDLHAHTTASDGIYSPAALVDYAVECGISILVIADHDTVGGIDEALAHAENKDITIIPAIEYSIDYDGGTFHLLGMFVDHKNEELRKAVKYYSDLRVTRARRIVEDLNDHGVSILLEEVTAVAGGGVVGKPHIARVLVNKGYADTVRNVFKSYLEKGMPGFVPKEKIQLVDAVSLTKNAGGIAVLAHPASLNLSQGEAMEQFLSTLKEAGVRGIEAYSEMHTEEEIHYYLELAERFDLVVTGGSDFHGDKGEIMGCYAEGKAVPYGLYDNLLEFVK